MQDHRDGERQSERSSAFAEGPEEQEDWMDVDSSVDSMSWMDVDSIGDIVIE